MNVLAWIFGLILAGGFGVAGVTKLLDLDRLREHFGYTKRDYLLIGLAEIAGVAGVIIGLVSRKYEWVAVAAGIGLAVLMIGALMTHARVQDEAKKVIPAAVMFIASALFLIFISVR